MMLQIVHFLHFNFRHNSSAIKDSTSFAFRFLDLPAIHCEDAAATAHQQDRKQKRNFLNPISTFPRLRENGVRSSHPICGHPMEVARRRLLAKAKKKSLTITVVIVVAFIVCWTPYYAMMVIFIFNLDPDQRITGELQSAIFFFGELSPFKRSIHALLCYEPRFDQERSCG